MRSYACDHSRAHQLYNEGLYGKNKFISIKCNQLDDCNPGKTALMGGYLGGSRKKIEGIYYLTTYGSPPFSKS